MSWPSRESVDIDASILLFRIPSAIIIAVLTSIFHAARLRASLSLLGPTTVVVKITDTILQETASRAFRPEGAATCRHTYITPAAAGGYVVSLNCVLAANLAGHAVNIVPRSDFESYAWLVRVAALVSGLHYLGMATFSPLHGMGTTPTIFVANARSAMVVLSLGEWLVSNLGIAGVYIDKVCDGVMRNADVWTNVRRSLLPLRIPSGTVAGI